MAAMAMLGCSGGGGNTAPQGPAPGSGDAAFKQIATEILDDLFKRHPTQATDLGIHKYDAQLDDYSAAAVESRIRRGARIQDAPGGDRPGVALARPAARSRAAAPRGRQHGAAERRDQALGEGSRSLQQRHHEHGLRDDEAQLRAAGRAAEGAHRARAGHARRRSPRRARTSTTRPGSSRRSRIEQIDGNVSFFKNDVPAAFKDVTDKALLAEFKKSNDAVIAALGVVQDVPAEGAAAEVEGRLRARRRHVREGARGARDGRAAARSAAADRRGGPAEERGRRSRRPRSRSTPSKPAEAVLGVAPGRSSRRRASCSRRRRTRSTRCGSSSSITTSSRSRRPIRRA